MPAAVAVDDPRPQPFADGQGRAVDLDGLLGLDSLEERQKVGERVVAALAVLVRGPAAVVDEVARGLQLLFGDAVQRQDLLRVHDRRIEAVLDRLVQHHGVQHPARRRLQPE